jgi:uncharacterized repeat protein (TIGR03803 family)
MMHKNSKCLVRLAVCFLLLTLNLALVPKALAQTWATNNPMVVARWSHTATLLNNGSVLIAGGLIYNVNGISNDTNACELYDPASGFSSLTAPMQNSRHSHVATLLPGGQVLVAGGGGQSSEVYDPPSASWINYASMNDERIATTATLLTNGQVLVAAGYDDSNGNELSTAETYDPDAQTWTSTGPMPYATDTGATALLPNGLVLFCGGSDGNGGAVTNTALYNPLLRTWTNTTPMNEARSGHTATLLTNGTVLIEGGTGDNTAEVYNPSSATWTYVANMNDGRLNPEAVLLPNGQVMVMGDGDPGVEVYDLHDDAWNYVDSLPVPANHQTATLLSGGQVVVTGGSVSEYNGPALSVIETYGNTLPIPALTVLASVSGGLVPLSVQFTSPDTDSEGNSVTNWSWDFGDGTTGTNQSPAHLYDSIGTFYPSLTVYSTFGGTPLTVSGPGTISVSNNTLTVSANPESGPLPMTVQFTSPGVDSGGNAVTNWSWDFGDGGSSPAQNSSHVYFLAGSFYPTLTAFSSHGSYPLSIIGPGWITVTNAPNPSFKTVYTFSANYGSAPNGGLVLAGKTLFGTTEHGGTGGTGTVFAVNTDGTEFTNLFDFSLNAGAIPNGDLILSGETLFGTTYVGEVFSINTNGLDFTNLYGFSLSTGEEPAAGLALAGGNLYGTTQYGGYYDEGVVFSVNTNGTGFTDLVSFYPAIGDYRINSSGLGPLARVIVCGGTLYGTTESGGSAGTGVVFSVNTNNPGSFAVLHYFSGTSLAGTNGDGAFPFAGLVASGNTLYGTAAYGGSTGNGTVFAVTTNGSTFSNLYSFTGGAGDGAAPRGGLVLSGNTLYGCASTGGLSGVGTLFAIHTDGSGFTNLYNFTGGTDGSGPGGNLLLSGITLYGTVGGGSSGDGTVFSFTLPRPLLNIQPAGNDVILTWSTVSPGYSLQSTPRLGATAAWTSVSPSPALVNGQNTVTNAISATQQFYRLTQ